MCFVIDKNNCPEALITTEEIKVYKFLRDVKKYEKTLAGWSPIKEFMWVKNQVYDAKISYDLGDIEKGFHAFSSLENTKANFSDFCFTRSGIKICEFIIPKGVKYYFNNTEIVSERMFWTGRINRCFLGFNFWSKII